MKIPSSYHYFLKLKNRMIDIELPLYEVAYLKVLQICHFLEKMAYLFCLLVFALVFSNLDWVNLFANFVSKRSNFLVANTLGETIKQPTLQDFST